MRQRHGSPLSRNRHFHTEKKEYRNERKKIADKFESKNMWKQMAMCSVICTFPYLPLLSIFSHFLHKPNARGTNDVLLTLVRFWCMDSCHIFHVYIKNVVVAAFRNKSTRNKSSMRRQSRKGDKERKERMKRKKKKNRTSWTALNTHRQHCVRAKWNPRGLDGIHAANACCCKTRTASALHPVSAICLHNDRYMGLYWWP